MSNAAVLTAGLASVLLDPTRVRIDPRKLTFHRVRLEPSDPDELKARNQRRLDLADSWLESPINEIIVRDGDYAIADGNERVAGILLRGVEEIAVTLLPAETPDSLLDEISLLTDFHKTTLKPFERARVAKRLLQSTGGKKADIAVRLRIDAGYLTKLLSLADCPVEVQQAAEASLIGVDDWYACSRSSEPLETLRIKLSGGNREAVHRSVRKPKNSHPVEKAARIPIRLSVNTDDVSANGVVTVASNPGAEIDFDSAEELLQQALKALRDAKKRGISLKTFVKAMRDMADAS